MSVDKIINPILPGFHPDPSICRVGDDFYIATSTFEWYPGIRIHHSTDLKNWRLVASPLNRPAMLNMIGSPDSCGVWAPCLTWSDGLFYLAYTDVKRFDGNFKDTHNYLTSCDTIDGEWSDPVRLNSSGFDPSLFHDDDGRKWLVNMIWDHRADRDFFAGIALQEYSPKDQTLIGERLNIFGGTDLDFTEAPHVYKKNGYYYLITAEGGTGYGHAVTMARSTTLQGPYEVDPLGPVITCRDNPEWPLQRSGHADIVETRDGDLYIVFLASRLLGNQKLSVLGRETAMQKLNYTEDGWYRLSDGGALPEVELLAPDLPISEPEPSFEYDGFDDKNLNPVYQWLRTPWPEEFADLSIRPGYLRLLGMESPGSLFRQALIARRQTSLDYEASTCVDFEPDNFQQMAGLIIYYNSRKFHYAYISTDDVVGRHIGIMSCEANPNMDVVYPIQVDRIKLPKSQPVHLRATANGAAIVFSWSLDGRQWSDFPVVLDAGLLSDEAGKGDQVDFTGTFIGVCCNDVTGMQKHADFDYFRYKPR